MAAEEVVLPTPPFPEVTTIIFANVDPTLLLLFDHHSLQSTRFY